MAKLPIYTQRYQTAGANASPEQFGAQEARGMTALGDQLVGIEQRRLGRNDVIERVRLRNQYLTGAQQEMERMRTEEDISAAEAPEKYRNFLAQHKQDTLAQFGGTNAGRAEAEAVLTGVEGEWGQAFYRESVAAQYKVLDESLKDISSNSSALAANDPSNLKEIIYQGHSQITEMAPALTPEQEQAAYDSVTAQAITSASATLMQRGDLDGAQSLLSSPEAATTIPEAELRKMRFQVATESARVDSDRLKLAQEVAFMETSLGRPMTEAEKVRLFKIGPDGSSMSSFAEKVAFLQAAGVEITQDVALGLVGINGGTEGVFGSSLRGRSMSLLNDGANAIASGTATEQQRQTYGAAAIELYSPKTIRNGMGETIHIPGAEMPPHVAEALQRGLPDVYAQIQSGRGMGEYTQPADLDTYEYSDANGIYHDIGLIAGPLAAVEGTFEGLYGVGALQDDDISRAKKRVELASRDMVMSLIRNPRYPEGDVKRVTALIEMMPGFFTEPTTAQSRLIVLDDHLAAEETRARKASEDPKMGVKERQKHYRLANYIHSVRASFKLPPRFNTREEMNAAVANGVIQPGGVFIAPNGARKKVPNDGE